MKLSECFVLINKEEWTRGNNSDIWNFPEDTLIFGDEETAKCHLLIHPDKIVVSFQEAFRAIAENIHYDA